MNKRKDFPGTSGLILEEPLIFERSVPGRTGCALPEDDIPDLPETTLPPSNILRDDIPGMPEVSEVDVVRHYTRLASWNYSVDHGFYPLGSCTMKYNPKMNEVAAGLDGFAGVHPLTPEPMAQGALALMYHLERYLAEISGFPSVSLQPAAGAQGELAGMLMIRAYHVDRNEPQRRVVLIPDSAHGTNPASAHVAGLKPVAVKSGPDGRIDPEMLKPYLNDDLAAIMMTNPNTLGIFETRVLEICEIIHKAGGLVYMDGANLNALMGISRPGDMSADVLHINLHKTFATPHGGGGPGAGPVAVTKALEPFLPIPRIVTDDNSTYRLDWNHPKSIGKLHQFYGNFGVMVKAYAYIRAMGPDGIRAAAETAVLNANYIKARLKNTYHITYNAPCKHECVLDDTYQHEYGVTTLDIAKRLMDYGFHPPTIYFPLIVKGALMIEPTETESLETLDAFIDAMLRIDGECRENPDIVKNAPHLPKLKRLDETSAARKPILRWTSGEEDTP